MIEDQDEEDKTRGCVSCGLISRDMPVTVSCMGCGNPVDKTYMRLSDMSEGMLINLIPGLVAKVLYLEQQLKKEKK